MKTRWLSQSTHVAADMSPRLTMTRPLPAVSAWPTRLTLPPPPVPLNTEHLKLETPSTSSWPIPIRWLRARREPGEQGAGDTLERYIAIAGGSQAAALWTRFTGIKCGCADRKAWLNQRYPYAKTP